MLALSRVLHRLLFAKGLEGKTRTHLIGVVNGRIEGGPGNLTAAVHMGHKVLMCL
jgi:hypothetical protein